MSGHRGNVLIVEDDDTTAQVVRLYLERDGYRVSTAHDGVTGLRMARDRPDLVIVDWMLPKLSGLEVCRELRLSVDVPIILLTAKSTEQDKLRGLDCGADDYVTKPFSPRELMARVRAVLRRAGNSDRLQFGPLNIDCTCSEARLNGGALALTPSEFRILLALCRRPGRVFTRAELVDRAFHADYEGTERTIDTHVANLRRKITPVKITTVFGVGYKFEDAQ